MDNINMIGIYPEAINSAINKCCSALDQYNCDPKNKIHDYAEEILTETGKWSNITNSIIEAYFQATQYLLKRKKKNLKVEYYVNCNDSHLYINQEEIF